MSIRFFRRIKLCPGLRLNVSKSGISASVGVRGAHLTEGPRGGSIYGGLPGTGLSFRDPIETAHEHKGYPDLEPARGMVHGAFIGAAIWVFLGLIIWSIIHG